MFEQESWHSMTAENPIPAYRYRPNNEFLMDSIEAALSGNLLWMSPLSTMDDLIEASVAVNPTNFSEETARKKAALERLAIFLQWGSELESNASGNKKTNDQFNAYLAQMVHSNFRTDLGDKLVTAPDSDLPNLVNDIRNELRCACFSDTPLSSPMWGLYASNNSGVCLQYDDFHNYKNHQIFNLRFPHVIEYSDEERSLDRYDIWEALAFLKYSQVIEAGAFSIMSKTDPRVTACKKLLLTKSKQWEWQKEFRVVDFEKSQGYGAWPHLKLSKIIFGHRTPDETTSEVRSRFAGRVAFSRVNMTAGSPNLYLVDL